MNPSIIPGLAVCVALTACARTDGGAPPQTPREDTLRHHQGQAVPEPYAWLEAMDSARVKEWVRRQARLTRSLLEQAPAPELAERLRRAAEVRRTLPPMKRGGRLFYVTGDSGFTRSSVWVQDGDGPEPRRLISAQSLPGGGRRIHRQVWPDPTGRYLAYGEMDEGSRWMDLKIRDLTSGQDLSRPLTGLVAGSSTVSWSADSRGLYYEQFELPPPGRRQEAALQHGQACANPILLRPACSDGPVRRSRLDCGGACGAFQTLRTPGFDLWRFRLAPGYALDHHAHDVDGLALCFTGDYRARFGSREYDLTPRRGLVLPAAAEHSESVSSPTDCMIVAPRAPCLERLGSVHVSCRAPACARASSTAPSCSSFEWS